MGSLGVALSTCTVPGTPSSTRLSAADLMEVGMGIHGEHGREQRPLPTLEEGGAAHVVADLLVEGVLTRLPLPAASPTVALLLNNLGALPVLDLLVVANDVVAALEKRQVRVARAYVGTFMTALEVLHMPSSPVTVPSD